MKATFYKLFSDAKIPYFAEKRSSGCDLCAYGDYEIYPSHVQLVRTGIIAKPPFGFWWELCLRSSCPVKNPGLVLANGVGIIDESYCGINDELKIALLNTSHNVINISHGQRIAQLVLRKRYCLDVEEGNLEELKEVESRGGFGSTLDK